MRPMRQTSSGLLIPVRMNEAPRYKCNFPGCDWVGWNPREQVDHIKAHVTANEAEIAEATTPYADKVIGDGYDPEHQQYLERRYKRLLPVVGPKEALDPRRY